MNNLVRLFTEANMSVLKNLSFNRAIHIRELAEISKVSPAAAINSVNLFVSLGFVITRKSNNKRLVELNRESLMLKKVRSLINFCEITSHPAFQELNKLGPVGIYGSFARGDDDIGSDIDMWIHPMRKLSLAELKPILRKIEKNFRKEVRLMILTKDRIRTMKANDPELYFRLMHGSVYDGDVFD